MKINPGKSPKQIINQARRLFSVVYKKAWNAPDGHANYWFAIAKELRKLS